MKVLVVEDDAINALSVAEELTGAGYEVLGPVRTLEAALSLARTHSPGVALVDIDLSRMGEGIDLARRLKTKGIASIFMTTQAHRARMHRDSALGIIAKPFRPEDISATVAALQEILAGGSPLPPPVPRALELFNTRCPYPKVNE